MNPESAAQDPLHRMKARIAAERESTNDDLSRGLQHLREEKFGAAYSHLRAAVILDPEAAAVQFAFGKSCLELGRIDEAEIALRKAIELNAYLAEGFHLLGRILAERGAMAEALECMSKYIENVANPNDALGPLAWSLIDLGRMEEAEELCRRAVAIRPGQSVGEKLLGQVLKRAGKFETAIEPLKMGAAADPNSDVILWELGDAYMKLGLVALAEESFRRLVQLLPENFSSRIRLANALIAQEKYKDALPELLEAAKLYHRPAEILSSYLAPAMLAIDLFDEAELALRKAIELDGEQRNAAAFFCLGIVHLLNGGYGVAVAELRRASRIAPASAHDFILACALLLSGQVTEAENTCARALFSEQADLEETDRPRELRTGKRPDGLVPVKVSLPWNLQFYKHTGAYHPLVLALAACEYEGFELSFPDPYETPCERRRHFVPVLKAFLTQFEELRRRDSSLTKGRIFDFLQTRNLPAQLMTDTDADITVYHSAPYTVAQTPWLLHIETAVTLFWPSLGYGNTKYVELEERADYRIVKAMIESDSCLGIFSHVKSTCESLPKLFGNPELAAKVFYVPLGLYVPPEAKRKIEARMTDPGSDDHVRILFTSSFNQSNDSFYSRGGLYVVNAFLEAAKRLPNIELVIRANLPSELRPYLFEELLAHPRVTIISKKLSFEEMTELYLSSDIFMIPSYTVHCHSLVTAMNYGCACVVSDAPAYDEFVTDGVTAVMAKGRRGSVYFTDSENGLIRESYQNMRQFDVAFANHVTETLIALCDDHDNRRRIGERARRYVSENCSIEAMQAEFHKVLKVAAERLGRGPRGTQPLSGSGPSSQVGDSAAFPSSAPAGS